ncbi:F0F1 ATP synthase subunit A [Sphingomonas morindae]|uniref:ATP synthase subunit a n=1 Tax=Sphingomonas morindae TaxID=1541170 RepID=A0ABY4XAW9_9SPHN|nr:F0F1 ATP synthase subunit A [Sphingomonas morindae]USI73826.1 F0F1 ATP synthase subunit A [Sphingomonas morindae]
MAEAGGGIDPMAQFRVDPVVGADWTLLGHNIAFTNSAAFMVVILALLWLFMLGGMRRQLVPNRWQAMVEGFTGFVSNMIESNIGPKGRAFTPYVFSLFMFILLANFIGLFPLALIPGMHPFTVTSHITVTGVLAIMSFSIVLIVGFARHGLHFFSLFIPHGTPALLVPLIFVIELVSFLVRPFSLGLRLFVAMTAGHILLDVFASFVIQGINSGTAIGPVVSLLSFVMIVGVSMLELLVAAIQAYVFALLTSLYLNDAINLH